MMMGMILMTHLMTVQHITVHLLKVNRVVLIQIKTHGLIIAIHALCNRVTLQKMVK